MIEDPEPRRTAEPFKFEARIGGVDRPPVVGAVIVVALVLLAIAKPWVPDLPSSGPGGSPAGRQLGAAPAASSRPSATPTPRPSSGVAAVSDFCLEPGSWRTATIETWHSRIVRVWRALDPVPASGPNDPAVPVVPAVGTSIPAIGYCAPGVGPDQPNGPADVDAWRLDGQRASPIRLRQVDPVGLVSPYGAMYGPPGGGTGEPSWPDGIVIFRLRERGSGIERWFGIEVRGVTDGNAASDPAPSVEPLP
jgi:hypothetical protein